LSKRQFVIQHLIASTDSFIEGDRATF